MIGRVGPINYDDDDEGVDRQMLLMPDRMRQQGERILDGCYDLILEHMKGGTLKLM